MEDIPDFMENMMNPDAGAASGGNGSGRNPHRRRHRHARHVIPIGRSGSGNQLADQFIQVRNKVPIRIPYDEKYQATRNLIPL